MAMLHTPIGLKNPTKAKPLSSNKLPPMLTRPDCPQAAL